MSAFEQRRVGRRSFLKAVAAGGVSLSWRSGQHLRGHVPDDPPILHNGIRLADPWPPRNVGLSSSPVTPPYLVSPPDVVPIDVGRQLFVDDFLIEETSLTRSFHRPEYYADNPVFQPATRWEQHDNYAERTNTRSNPTAMPFSDGIFYDPAERVFKMWYMGGYTQNTCYATSSDGINWHRPQLDVISGTNIVTRGPRDSSTVWLDVAERDRSRRYKMALYRSSRQMELFSSADGVHWHRMGETGYVGDRTTFFFNPFRNVWVYSIRGESASEGVVRHRRYWETPDLFANVQWKENEPVVWVGADDADTRRKEYNVPAELYNLDCVAYESVLLGLFTIFRGELHIREKPNDVCVGFSRDGFHWHRPDRQTFMPVSEQVGSWNWANVQSAGGCCLIVGDKLYFYVSARRGVPNTDDPGRCTTGLATMRRDGFVSVDDGFGEPHVRRQRPRGVLTTRPVRFQGKYLFVNVDAARGELRAEVLDRHGRPIAPFVAESCVPVTIDSTRTRITWTGAADLRDLAGETVRFRFHLTRGRLFAFWVSPTTNGASRGYVAAGGPGFRQPIDDVGDDQRGDRVHPRSQ